MLDVDKNINCLKPYVNIKYLCGKFILVVKVRKQTIYPSDRRRREY